MKAVLRWCVVPLLATGLMAQTAAKPKARKKMAKPAEPAVTLQDVQALRDALAAQQQQIEALKQSLQQRDEAWQQAQQQLQQAQSTASDAQQKAAAVQSAADAQQATVSKLSSDVKDVQSTLTNTAADTQEEQKRVSALESAFGRFRFNGDVRVRGENFNQNGTQDRNRGRIRVRFGFDGKLNEDFLAGISIATGSMGDPTSTNETLTNFFDRKTISLDRGWITYNPLAHKWLSLTGGKFAYTWQKTPATFDADLNPEGFNQKFSFDLHGPWLKNVTFQGIELLYNESGGGQDSYALGGQMSAKLQMGRWTATPSFLSLKWNRPDAILAASAFAVGATTTGVGGTTPAGPYPVPGEGPGCASVVGGAKFANCPFGPNGMTNATYVGSNGVAHFYSGFNYADFILNNQIKTGNAKLPLNILAEFLDNLDAEPHPLSPSGAVLTDLGSQNKEYGVDVSIGQTKSKNDLQFGYAWNRQEQDSAIASFVESDQRAPTNIIQNRVYALWKVRANTVASFTWWRGRTLNTGLENAVKTSGTAAGAVEPYLNRMQFDVIYTF
ncbi:MAG TPA: putative porin [Terriglobales bacterium]|nr:putative porin [Terriglobales bacterium]